MICLTDKLLVTGLLTLLVSVTSTFADRHSPRVCQEITIPMCKGIGYNHTYMPNQFNHDNQEEAGLEVHQFWPLVEIQCSPDLQFFLCSVYTPICVENYKKPLPACRSVCERAKTGCAPLMRQYGFPWPERMRCEDLPEFGDKQNLCMDFNTSNAQQTTTRAKTKPETGDTTTTPSPWRVSKLPNPLDSIDLDGTLPFGPETIGGKRLSCYLLVNDMENSLITSQSVDSRVLFTP